MKGPLQNGYRDRDQKRLVKLSGLEVAEVLSIWSKGKVLEPRRAISLGKVGLWGPGQNGERRRGRWTGSESTGRRPIL